jgi:tRNA A37 threonylcarbamoyladenosine dehydratase
MDMFERTRKIVDDEKINKLKNTSVLLVGVGGVGGSCLEMLIRSGINYITIIDFDDFEESNLNRQILSLTNNIGKSKVLIAEERIKLINPNVLVKAINAKVDDNLSLPLTDYIIDACDDINAKVLLVKHAIKHNIKIISSCGTGNRIKPDKLYISNIWKTEYDPLAKKLRYTLRKENIDYKLPVVCSKEIPLIKQSGKIGSMAMVPNSAGILLASYVINDIIRSDENVFE